MSIETSPQGRRLAHQAPGPITAAMVIGSAAMLVLGLAPVLLGALAAEGRISEAGVGQTAMAEIFALAIGALVGPFFMMAGRMRFKVCLLAGLLVIVNVSMIWVPSGAAIIAVRALAGLVAGLLLGCTNAILTHSRQPQRMSGLLLSASFPPQIALAYLIPTLIVPRLGADGSYLVIAGCAALALLCSPLLVDRIETPARQAEDQARVRWSLPLLLAVLAIFVLNCGLGAIWAYVDRIAREDGFSPSVAGWAVAISIGFQFCGAMLAAWQGARIPARAALVIGTTIQFVAAIVIFRGGSVQGFVAAVCILAFLWPALQPVQVGELIALDPSRRMAMLLGPIILMGNGLGPLAASLVVTATTIRPGLILSTGMIGLSIALFASLLCLKPRRPQRIEAVG